MEKGLRDILNNIIEISNEQQLIDTIKQIDLYVMDSLNARLQFSEMLNNIRNQTGAKKRNFKEEQDFINNAAKKELYPGTAYAIWPTIFEFARELNK